MIHEGSNPFAKANFGRVANGNWNTYQIESLGHCRFESCRAYHICKLSCDELSSGMHTTWYKWNDFASHIIQFFYLATAEGFNEEGLYLHYPDLEEKPHTIIYHDRWRENYLVVYVELFQHQVDKMGGYAPAPSHAQYILPYLVSPMWKRTHTLIAHRRAGLKPWLKSNLEKPAVFIETPEFIYISTDDLDDYTLLKIKIDPKNWEPFY